MKHIENVARLDDIVVKHIENVVKGAGFELRHAAKLLGLVTNLLKQARNRFKGHRA